MRMVKSNTYIRNRVTMPESRFEPAIVDATYSRVIEQRIGFAEIEIQNTSCVVSRESEIFAGEDRILLLSTLFAFHCVHVPSP